MFLSDLYKQENFQTDERVSTLDYLELLSHVLISRFQPVYRPQTLNEGEAGWYAEGAC